MGYNDRDAKKREADALLADAQWFAERMAAIVTELKTAKGRQAQYLRGCLSSAMEAHATCTREGVAVDIENGRDF